MSTSGADRLGGRGASADVVTRLQTAILEGGEFERIVHLTTFQFESDEVVVGARVTVASDLRADQLTARIDAAQRRMRAAVPQARTIYLEPDIERGQPAAPVTDAIVIRGAD